MTDLVKSLKIGNNSYTIQDSNTIPGLTLEQRTTLLSSGTYLGNHVGTGKVFETVDGKFEVFSDTITGTEINTSGITNPTFSLSSISQAVDGAYNGSLLMFASASNTYIYSTDKGTTWSSGTFPEGMTHDKAVTYANGFFVVVEQSNNKVAYSTDGINWNTSTLPYTDLWYHIKYLNNQWFIFAFDWQYYSRRYLVSDSLEGPWTAYQYPTGTNCTMEYKNGTYYLFNTNKVYTSTDAHTWTNVHSFESNESVYYTGVACIGDYFVVGLGKTNKVASSTDGINWTKYDIEGYSNGLYPIKAVGTMVFASCYGHSIYNYSNDYGETWTSIDRWQLDHPSGDGRIVVADDYIFLTGQSSKYAKIPVTIQHTYSLTPLSYTKAQVDLALGNKQGTLTAGAGISIASDVISTPAMTGADGTSAGTLGAVPAPAATDNTKFLRGDGTWAEAGGGGSSSYIGVNSQSMAGTTDPTSSTEASIGTLYVNTTTSTPFICVNNTMTPNFSLHTEATGGYSTVTNGILEASSGYAAKRISLTTSSTSTVSYVTKIKVNNNAASLTNGRYLFNMGEDSHLNSFGLYLDSSGVLALSLQSNGSWSQRNSTIVPVVGSYIWLSFSIGSNGSVTSNVSLDGETWQQLCSPFTYSSSAGFQYFYLGDAGPAESGWEIDTDLTKTHLYINGVEEKLFDITNVAWSELHDSSVVQSLPASPTSGKIYFVTGS